MFHENGLSGTGGFKVSGEGGVSKGDLPLACSLSGKHRNILVVIDPEASSFHPPNRSYPQKCHGTAT